MKSVCVFCGSSRGIKDVYSEKAIELADAMLTENMELVYGGANIGLMKIIVDKPAEAQLALADRGMACALKDVVAVTAPDQPGNLDKLTTALLEKNVNIKDAYGFVSPRDKQGICFLEVDNPEGVDLEKTIAEHGFSILGDKELYEL